MKKINFFKEGHSYEETYQMLLRGFKDILDEHPLASISSIVDNVGGITDLLSSYTEMVLKENMINNCIILIKCDSENNPPRIIDRNNFNYYINVKHPFQEVYEPFSFMLPEDFKKLKGIDSDTKENTTHSDNYEMVNHPNHYNQYSVEVIDMMLRIWGPEATIQWCEMTAFKYRMRVGTKPENSIEQDLAKEKWYLDKAYALKQDIKIKIEKI